MAQHKRRKYEIQGSLARKVETQREYEYQSSVADIPVIREIQLKKANKSRKAGMVFKVFVVFSLAMLVIFRYARITELGYEYNKYHEIYQEVKAENERLKVEIEKSINLAKVRQVAEQKLDMRRPDSYQIISIEVEKIDTTEMSENNSAEEEKGLISKISDWIKNILGFIE